MCEKANRIFRFNVVDVSTRGEEKKRNKDHKFCGMLDKIAMGGLGLIERQHERAFVVTAWCIPIGDHLSENAKS